MTCIVAIEQDGKVFMGADRMGSNGYTGGAVTESKIIRNGSIVIGYTSSFRMGQILQYGLEIPVITENIDKWVAVDFTKAVRKAFEENDWHQMKDGIARGGTFLLAVAGRCYRIQDDYSFIREISGEYAVGSGQDYALGSLRSTRKNGKAKERILEALETAAEYVVTVGGPFDVIEVDKFK